MSLKAAFFDIDGTLVDSNDFHIAAWEEVFAGVGVHIGRPAIHAQIGKGADMLVPALLPGADAQVLGKLHREIFASKYIEQVRPFPGARELLARVRGAGQDVVFATSAGKADLEHYLDLLDARDLVSARTSSDDVEHSKPAPDIFVAALKKLEPLAPGQAIVIGDSPYDLEAAKRCGIPAIGLRSGGFSDGDLEKMGPLAIYDDVARLLRDYDHSPLAVR